MSLLNTVLEFGKGAYNQAVASDLCMSLESSKVTAEFNSMIVNSMID